jgi:hemolysin activation/secretion protein
MNFRIKFLPPASALLLCCAAGAQTVPDAGSLLRDEMRRDQPTGPVMPPKVEAAVNAPKTPDSGPKTQINAFHFVGLRAIPESEAQAFMAPFAGQAHSLEGLHQIADQFEQWLRARGLFAARAYVPPQDIKDGDVEIRVLEGHVEGIDIKRSPDTRLGEETLRNTVGSALPVGGSLEQSRLERGVLLLNDLPATSARAVLVPGKEQGGSRVVVEAAQGPIPSGSVEIDNTGNRFTGDWRLGAGVTLNDPLGFGDQWSLRASKSQGSEFVRGAYTLPLGSSGLKAGVSLIQSSYTLCCDSAVSALNSNGEATALSGFMTYPLIRTRTSNLALSTNLTHRDFVNRSLNATTSDKESKTLTLGANGDWSDAAGLTGQGAFSSYSLQWTSGRLNLDGWAADKTQDTATAKSHGNFDKWNAQLSHLLRLSGSSALYAAVSAQWAGKNLDSSEKFALGGPQGIRAYPAGEATGDEGWLLNLEWRNELNKDWRMVAFVDYGEVRLHRTTWANWNSTNTHLNNRYALSGVGATAAWTPTANSQFSATLATRIGENPARDATGRDSDSRPARPQLWLHGSMAF